MPLLIAELSRQHHLKDSECFKTKPDCHSLAASCREREKKKRKKGGGGRRKKERKKKKSYC